jgi:hypothetical protein
MTDNFFVGRDEEILQMKKFLLPGSDSPNRKILVLGGMGGIGKTQLAITYAKRHRHSYSSIFWLNANTEATLTSSLRALANQILPSETVSKLDDNQLWAYISNWLSILDNTRWLLISDNYNDPDQYEITTYNHSVAHGSIIITTRQPYRLNGDLLKLGPMTKLEDSLGILATRSGRQNVQSGEHCHAKRREGLLTNEPTMMPVG